MDKLPVYKNREEISAEYKWQLEDIYDSAKSYEKALKEAARLTKDITRYMGRLKEGSNILLECLFLSDKLMTGIDSIYAYSKMKRDENTKLTESQELSDKADAAYIKATTAASFIIPEISSLDPLLLDEYIADPALESYRHSLENIKRQKKHILSEKEERILSMAGEVLSSPGEIFTMFDNADITFGKIKGEDGKKTALTKGNYIPLLHSRKRRVRKAAYKEIYSSYRAMENTLAKTLAVNTKANTFMKDLRNYNSCIEMALYGDNIKTEVYTNLISVIDENQDLIDRYLKLRKKMLKVKKLRMYDVYVPIVDVPETLYTYEEAVDLVVQALSPLGSDYIKALRTAFDQRWVDVYETEGKKSGAYSWGSYGSHPYVLLNFQGTIKDVFTIAHEMGHALHSYYSNKKQTFINSMYPIFLAEVASTTNEIILADYLIKNSKDDKEKAYLLNHYLEEFRTTVFRQTMFAEFELLIHQAAETDIPLTTKFINDTYISLVKKHFGNVTKLDDEIASEWSRIPHFYSSFYVYKYATGFCAAAALAENILHDKPGAVLAYLEFLSGGGSDYPLVLLKKAGVDLSSPEPIKTAMNLFANTLHEMETLL